MATASSWADVHVSVWMKGMLAQSKRTWLKFIDRVLLPVSQVYEREPLPTSGYCQYRMICAMAVATQPVAVWLPLRIGVLLL